MKTLMKIIIAVFVIGLIMFDSEVNASENRVFLGGWSYHIDAISLKGKPERTIIEKHQIEGEEQYEIITRTEKYEYNETHNVVAYARNNWMVGYFLNSHKEHSAFIGYSVYGRQLTSNINMNIYAGAVYGYRDCYGAGRRVNGKPVDSRKVCPMVSPVITFDHFETVQPYVALFGYALTVGLSKSF